MTSHPIRLGLFVSENRGLKPLEQAIATIETAVYQIIPRDRPEIVACDLYLLDRNLSNWSDAVKIAAHKPIIALCEDKATGHATLDQGAMDYWLWSAIDATLCERSLRLVRAIASRGIMGEDVTEVEYNQQLLETIAKTSPLLFYLYDVNQGCYTYINHQVTQILGYTPTEIQQNGNNFFRDRFHPDTASPPHPEDYFTRIQRHEVVELEYRLRHKDGSWRWLRSQEVIFRCNRDRSIAQILGIAQDITAHKSIEMQLWRSEARLNAIVANLSDGILIVDRHGFVSFANPAALRLFRQTSEDLIGREFGLPLLTSNTTEINIVRADGSSGVGEISVAIAQWDNELGYIVCARDISVRRQAEETLRESEERFQQLANHLQAVFWLADFSQGRLVYVSPAFETIWGRSSDYLTEPNRWLETVVPEDRPIILQARDRHQKGHLVEIEYRIMRPDGEIRWISDRAFPVADKRGKIIRAAGISQDITERKQADLALRQSEERWRALFEQAAVGIFVVSLNGRFEQVNQKFCDLLGYTLSELMDLEYIQIDANASEAEARQRWQRLIAGELSTYSVEKAYKTKQNYIIWVSIALSLVCDPDGNPLYVIGAVTDLSDRVTAELALRQQIHRERLLAQIAQNIHSSADLDEILNLMVEDTRQLLEVDRALIFRLLPNYEGVVSHESTREGFASTLGKRFQEEEFPPDCYRYYCQGEPRVIPDIETDEIAACLVSYLQGLNVKSRLVVPIMVGEKLWGLLIVHQCQQRRDWQSWEVDLLRQVGIQGAIALQQTQLYHRLNSELQERRQVQTQLEQAKDMADAANRAKSEFLANMSHELRTPLNAILGFTQLLDRTTKQSQTETAAIFPQQQEYIEIIKRSGEHLLALINDILDLSKIEAGHIDFTPESFDLWQMLDQIEEMFSFKAAQKGLALYVERSPHLPQYIETDCKKLRSTLINLLSNAVKFTETGHVILRVTVLPTPLNPTTLTLGFAVEDTGIGIKSTELPLIFDAFRQSHTPIPVSCSLRDRTTEGTGLGLAISQHFVRLLGGEIRVRSQWDRGSVFQFNISCRAVETLDSPPKPIAQHPIAIAHQTQDYRIAIVEDDPTNCQLLTRLLEPLGFKTRSAVNGIEGVELWRAWQPHLILMDIRMPLLDGDAAIQQIRQIEAQNPQRSPVSIIGLTASVFQTPQAHLKELGCQEWIVKPFSEADLLSKIAKALHLDYEYAVQSQTKEKPTHALIQDAIVKAELETMSAQWRSQLRLAALSARQKKLQELVAQLPPEKQQITMTLSYWIDRLDFDRIIEFTTE